MPPTLITLPPELLEMIADVMANSEEDWNPETSKNTSSLHQLRMACRYLQAVTRKCFVSTHFSARIIRLDHDKIHELWEISRVPDLASAVRSLYIHCENEGLLRETNTKILADMSPTASGEALLRRALQPLCKVEEVELCSIVKVGMPRSNERPWNASAAFTIIMSAITACDFMPPRFRMAGHSMCGQHDHSDVGLLGVVHLEHPCSPLSKFEVLELRYFRVPPTGLGTTARGMQLAQQILGVAKATPRRCLGAVLQHAHMPGLELLVLRHAAIRAPDLLAFLQRQATTLHGLSMHGLCFFGGPLQEQLRPLLQCAQDELRLEDIAMTLTGGKTEGTLEMAEFPGADFTLASDVEVDGWVFVRPSFDFSFHGREEVVEGLSQALSCMEIRVVAVW